MARNLHDILAVTMLLGTIVVAAHTASAETYTTLYSFPGTNAASSLVLGADGNLYGTTYGGIGSCSSTGCGTVFELMRTSSGWQEIVLYNFTGQADGANPDGLTFDAAGNLYGTARHGGIVNTNCSGLSCGVVFELTPSSSGWNETVLYSFTGVSDGSNPFAGVVFDNAGNLYGTTYYGGNGGCSVGSAQTSCGTVFELTPSSTGWTESVLYRFTGGADGANPAAPLILDGAGNLYGTTYLGGNSGSQCIGGTTSGTCGVVFELARVAGNWTEIVLHRFSSNGPDIKKGTNPLTGLTFDALGNLYGTTELSGGFGDGYDGVVFELTKTSTGWKESVLHRFTGGSDGAYPGTGVILDSSGNVYTSTEEGGSCSILTAGCGTVLELRNEPAGWRETVLYDFTGGSGASCLISDSVGNFYGCAQGTIFELSP